MSRQERIRQKLNRRRARREMLRAEIERHAKDILESRNFRRSDSFIQHGAVSVRSHCLSVAECSLLIEKRLNRLGVRCAERDLVRGALLHDYFLYDWHGRPGGDHRRLHGFYHPGVALRNAGREYALSERERDIIAKHMWPLTVKPPLCREAWIVTAADKYCSLREIVLCRGGAQEE